MGRTKIDKMAREGLIALSGLGIFVAGGRALADTPRVEEVTFVSRVVSLEKSNGKTVEYVSGGRVIIDERVRDFLKGEDDTRVTCIHAVPGKSWNATFEAGGIGTPYPEAAMTISARTIPDRISRDKTLEVESDSLSSVEERFVSRHPNGVGLRLSELVISGRGDVSGVVGLPASLPAITVGIRDGEAPWPPEASREPSAVTESPDRIVRYHPMSCWMFFAN